MSLIHKVFLHDGDGNPIGSLGGAINVHDADVHNVVVNQYFHQHTGTSTTLAVAAASDGSDYVIDVVDASSFIAGDRLQIGGGANHTGHKYGIKSIATNAITLHERVDYGWPIGTTVEKVIVDMNVAGTQAAPEEFKILPNTGQVIHITRIIIEMTDGTAGDLGDLGGIADGIADGILLRVNVDGQYGTFTNWKTNADMKNDMYDFDFDDRAGGGGTYGFTARGSFNKVGVAVRLDDSTNDFMEIYIQDDLTDLLSFKIKAQGHIEG